MTTDFIQYKHLTEIGRKAQLALSKRKAQRKPKTEPLFKRPHAPHKIELPRDSNILNGSDDIFDVLTRAEDVLENVESQLKEKDKAIETLEDLSGLDHITGLLNRRGFTKALVREVSRTNRDLSQGGLLVIFSFENLENMLLQHGEKAAHRALKLIAQTIENEIRPIDWAGRINEEEFVLLFPHTSMEAALNRLQNMALRLNKLSLIWGGEEIRISLSLGLKSYEKGESPEDIFLKANLDLQRNRKTSQNT